MKEKTEKKTADNVTVMQNDFTKAQHSQKRIFQREKKAHMRRSSLVCQRIIRQKWPRNKRMRKIWIHEYSDG